MLRYKYTMHPYTHHTDTDPVKYFKLLSGKSTCSEVSYLRIKRRLYEALVDEFNCVCMCTHRWDTINVLQYYFDQVNRLNALNY